MLCYEKLIYYSQLYYLSYYYVSNFFLNFISIYDKFYKFLACSDLTQCNCITVYFQKQNAYYHGNISFDSCPLCLDKNDTQFFRGSLHHDFQVEEKC